MGQEIPKSIILKLYYTAKKLRRFVVYNNLTM